MSNQYIQQLTGVTSVLGGYLIPMTDDPAGTSRLKMATVDQIKTYLLSNGIVTPSIVGGSSTTSTLILKSTSGVGATGADIVFQVGNNGATEVARFLNNGTTTFTGITGITWITAGVSSALMTIGTQGTGGSIFVQTGSLNVNYASGFGVSGTYASQISTINIGAYGVNSSGGYGSNLAFLTSNNTSIIEAARFDKSQNFGVGSISPLGRIEARATSGAQLVCSYDASNYLSVTTGSAGAVTLATIGSATSFNFSGGNVGIGCVPVTLLDVQAAANPQARIYSTGVGSSALFQIRNDAQIWQFITDGSDSNKFKLKDGGGNVAVAVDTSLNVGIGSASPLGRLEARATSGAQFAASYDASNYLSATVASNGSVTLTSTGTTPGFTFSPVPNGLKKIITCVIDGGGAIPSTGFKGFVVAPFAGTIVGVRIFGDVSGSAVVDIWKTSYGNTAPVVGNTITASALPTLSSALTNQDNTLTGWTKSVAANDLIGFNLNSVSTCTKVTVELLISIT